MTEEQVTKKTRVEELSQLEQLSLITSVVADTGDVNAIQQFCPQDATTNPSLIFSASQLPQYQSLVNDAISYGTNYSGTFQEKLDVTMDKIAVNFGAEITKIVPGYVSTEVDARLSFDTEATIQRARRIISMYNDIGIDKSRILIKIASTYEGIRAAEVLQKEGISCNLTLLFSLIQAAACAEAGITLISPFVGRIMDWFKVKTGKTYTGSEDPGVLSVSTIYGYYKKFHYNTIVMGASFRNIDEILSLAGCDKLTISPTLLNELKNNYNKVERILDPFYADKLYSGEKLNVDEKSFRWLLNQDAMATEKLAEGIRNFAIDIVKLENIVRDKLIASETNK